MQIGFIGAGKVGCSLGKYFSTKGVCISGYYSKNPDSAAWAAEFTGTRSFATIQEAVKQSDTLFLTVPDGEISTVWGHIRELPVKDKKICHCSGCISASVFDGIEALGAFGYSVHPLYAVNHKQYSYEELQRALFTLEGSSFYLQEMEAFLSRLGNSVQVISGAKKELYHAAAVFASNHMTALAETAQALLRQCGFSVENAERALSPLMLGNIKKVCEVGTREALTGPVERNDTETVAKHLRCLPQESKGLYRLLTQVLIGIGEEKHPDRSYETMKRLLAEDQEET